MNFDLQPVDQCLRYGSRFDPRHRRQSAQDQVCCKRHGPVDVERLPRQHSIADLTGDADHRGGPAAFSLFTVGYWNCR